MNNEKTAVYIRFARARNVGLYCRVACADEEALALQESALLNYAETNGYENGEFNVHHYYRDNGGSGLTYDRPGMNKLMDDIQNGRVDVVLVKSISRITRDIINFGDWLRFLREHNVRLVSMQDGILC
jgi:DNA invertase Pin-like site-specific DNA recombinase